MTRNASAFDRDGFGSTRLETMNVTDANDLERDLPGGPVPSSAHPARAGHVDGQPRVFLEIEAGAIAAAAIAGFSRTGESWWIFAAFILVPDLSMLAYLAGPRLGALIYNGAHVYVGPILLAGVAALAHSPLALAVALVWVAHIGIDRLLGFGLKHSEGFEATHLGRIGRGSPAEPPQPS